jgi:uncharacterized protein
VTAGVSSGTYKLTVLYNNSPVEVFDHLYVGAAWASNVNYITTRVNAESSYITVAVLDDTQTTLKLSTVTLSGGLDGAPVSASDVVGSVGAPPTIPATGIQIFRDTEERDVNVVVAPGQVDAAVVAALIDLCETRGDCVTLIDTPFGISVSEAVDWHNGVGVGSGYPSAALDSSFASLYYPWVQVQDGYNNAATYIPPTGHALRALAYTDQVAYPWFAPAGPNRGRCPDIIQVHHSATQGERDLMMSYGNAINPIVSISGVGTQIYGEMTLQRTYSALNRLHVRRMVLYLRKIIASSVRFLQFEQNNQTTWNRFQMLVTPALNQMVSREGIEQDFRVICDATTNTATLRNNNQMLGRILITPIHTAEIINVEFALLPSGASFTA